jgi:two-component system chemotaxis sensor kinase CheA
MATLGAPAPKSFSEVWPDGSITPSESAELYAQEFVAAAAEAHHGTAAFATALGEASAAAAAATQARLERVRFLNAVAMGTGLLLLAVLIFQLRSALAAPNGEAVAQRALEIPQAQTSADGETDAATTAAAADAAPVGEATEVNESAGADVQSAATEPAAAESAHAEIARPTEAQAAPHAMTAAAIAPAVGHVDPIDATQQIMKVAESAFDAATATPASVIAESASALAASIGADLARDIRIVTRGLDHVPAHLIATTREIVLQLVRNAAVHGIEAPVHRTASGKQSCGSITIEVMTDPQAGTWELSVEDDGRGISRDRLRAAAVRKGLMTAEQAEALDGIKLIALLFKPGFTTAEEVTAHAGRGVGMGVVRSMVEELGGRIGVATKPGRFTRFRISLPMSLADEVAA